MKEFLEKLIEFFQPEKEDDTESSIGICLIDDEPIELTVNAALKVEYSKDHLYIDCDDYIGIIRIDRIVQIHEI